MNFTATVFRVDADGQRQQLSPDGGVHYQPTIDPAGTAIVWWGGDHGPPRLWRHEIATGRVEALTAPEHGARQPALSWDGQWLAFVSDRCSSIAAEPVEQLAPSTRKVSPQASFDLFIARADGSEVRRVTDGPSRDLRPTFTPDGQRLLFVSDRGTDSSHGPRLWSVDVDGASEPRLIVADRWVYRPWCTPDGRAAVVYASDGQRDRLYRVDLEKAALTPLPSDDRGVTHGPFVTPDGHGVIAHSTRDGPCELWRFGWDDALPQRVLAAEDVPASHGVLSRSGILAFDVVNRPA